ncbi:ubiquinol-cytochrome c reductase iron-sulfur subunit [Nocardia sp. NBC_01009]|uniref:QcrA and Rieske domain-containing protein n=1 Tax=Nocardia sp. NBC_01009 TaxID=2975996 RepID=UPI00386E6F53|nr:Rieske (2Fe-2S) protein [Nocardia sp. NBC_01009]
MTIDEFVLRRRTVVAGAGAVAAAAALTACSTYGKSESAAAPASQPATAAAPGPNAAAGQPNPNAITNTADVPVGGGVISGDTVVTQPSAGTFVGLSSVCTHAGCKVADVSGGTINCACHGSKFGLDGSVVNGPATQPLAAKNVRVEGDSVVLG